MLHLHQLESAIRPQFIFKKMKRRTNETEDDYILRSARHHPLHTDKDHECSEIMALMVFIGLSDLYGHDRDEVVDYLGIERHQYREYREHYQKAMSEAVQIKAIGGRLTPHTIPQKVYVKTALVLNYIILNFGEGRVRLADLPNG